MQRVWIDQFILLLFCHISSLSWALEHNPLQDANELLLKVFLNQQDLNEVDSFLKTPSGEIWIEKSNLERWHLQVPEQKEMIYENKKYDPLSAFAGSTYEMDQKKMSVSFMIPANWFQQTNITQLESELIKPPVPGYCNLRFYPHLPK